MNVNLEENGRERKKKSSWKIHELHRRLLLSPFSTTQGKMLLNNPFVSMAAQIRKTVLSSYGNTCGNGAVKVEKSWKRKEKSRKKNRKSIGWWIVIDWWLWIVSISWSCTFYAASSTFQSTFLMHQRKNGKKK